MFYERVRYEIVWDGVTYSINEPKGWDEEGLELVRNDTYHGISVELSNSLEFYGDAKSILSDAYFSKGVNALCYLNRYVKNKTTDIFELDYIGWFDFNEFKLSKDKVTIKFNSNPLGNLFKSKKGTKIEYDRVTRLNGDTIPEGTTTELDIHGRHIYLLSQAEMKQFNSFNIEVREHQDAVRYMAVAFNTEKVGEKTDDPNMNKNVLDSSSWTTGTSWYNGISRAFYSVADKTRTLQVTVDYNISVGYSSIDVREHYLWIRLARYDKDGNYLNDEWSKKFTLNRDEFLSSIDDADSFSIPVTIKRNESLVMEVAQKGKYAANWANYSKAILRFGNSSSAHIKVEEHSYFGSSKHQFIYVKDALNKVSDVCFNVPVESSLYTSGMFSGLGLISGRFLRNIYKQDNPDEYKPISYSFDELYKSLSILNPIGVSIEMNKLKIEELSYFYQSFVFASIGAIQDMQLYTESKLYYTSIEIGYTKSEVDTNDGSLDEFNCQTEFSTPLVNNTAKLSLLSKYRADGDGIEITRRDILDLTSSNKADGDIWFVDTKPSGNGAAMRVWQDDFQNVTGVYSKDEVMNVRLSPANCLRRHGSTLNAFLNRVGGKIKYVSSVGNTKMTSQLLGSNVVVKENSDINPSELDSALFGDLFLSFTTPFDLGKVVNKTTNGIKNFYGLLECNLDEDTFVRGYIVKMTKQKNKYQVVLRLKL